MSSISEITANTAQTYGAAQSAGTQKSSRAQNTGQLSKTANYGATIGKPQLSEEGAKYYDELKKKYGDMDFVLVSKDMIDVAKNQASSYGNKNRMVVLIDEEKIEKMASDESYRKQYEGLITKAQTAMPQLQQMMANNANVKTIGMQVGNDGRASFFAVMDKSAKDFQSKIEAKRAAKKEAAKKEAKKAEKEAQKEKLEEARAEKAKAGKAEKAEKAEKVPEDEDYEILMADSIEELMNKIDDWTFAFKSDTTRTAAERVVGQSIDFRA